jgi:rubrerythrin
MNHGKGEEERELDILSESDSGYMKRFEMNIETLIMAGGRHILCSPELMDKEDDELTKEEIETKENKFKAICFIKRSDPNRYKSLLSDL